MNDPTGPGCASFHLRRPGIEPLPGGLDGFRRTEEHSPWRRKGRPRRAEHSVSREPGGGTSRMASGGAEQHGWSRQDARPWRCADARGLEAVERSIDTSMNADRAKSVSTNTAASPRCSTVAITGEPPVCRRNPSAARSFSSPSSISNPYTCTYRRSRDDHDDRFWTVMIVPTPNVASCSTARSERRSGRGRGGGQPSTVDSGVSEPEAIACKASQVPQCAWRNRFAGPTVQVRAGGGRNRMLWPISRIIRTRWSGRLAHS